MSLCGARMKPIGLMFKHAQVNPFTGRTNGDLMIVHECTNCGKISPNRIAGDDNVYMILSILDESLSVSDTVGIRLQQRGISMLTQADKNDVKTALFGLR